MLVLAAKPETSRARSFEPQAGHRTSWALPVRMRSNSAPHASQLNSYIGMSLSPEKI